MQNTARQKLKCGKSLSKIVSLDWKEVFNNNFISCCSVLRLALYQAAILNIFLSFYIFFVCLLWAAQHLTPTVVCDSSFYFVYYYCMCVKSHTFIFLSLLELDNA